MQSIILSQILMAHQVVHRESLRTLGGPWGGPQPENAPKFGCAGVPTRYISFSTFMQATPRFTQVKSFHTRIFYLYFSWYSKSSIGSPWQTRSSIANHWRPLGALGAAPQPENAQNVPKFGCAWGQTDTFCFLPSMQATPSFPLVKSFHSRIFYLYFSWHSKSSIGSPWGVSGALGGPLRA